MRRHRVVIVDDHAMVRSGLRMLINAQRDIEVVGEAGTLGEAIDVVDRVGPDVVTLDLSLPGGTSAAGIDRLRAAAPEARILVVTMHDDPAFVRTAIAMGASGYVAKSAADTELVSAIRAVAAGRVFVDVQSARSIGGVLDRADREGGVAPIDSLSQREREVFEAVARGHTSQAVADRLGLSVKTIESYRARVMQKLGLRSRADVVRLAIDCGVLNADPKAAAGESPA
ncbi:MAG: response regulator transcription factor [Phycisphaerales bacterium]